MDGIDAIDRRLLDLLRVDGRASWADLGGRVGLSASAVRRRVDRLTARGVVQGFTVQVDPDAERTPGVAAYVELFCRGTVAPAELQRMLSAVPEVVTAGTVTGRPTRWSCCARATCSPGGRPGTTATGGERRPHPLGRRPHVAGHPLNSPGHGRTV